MLFIFRILALYVCFEYFSDELSEARQDAASTRAILETQKALCLNQVLASVIAVGLELYLCISGRSRTCSRLYIAFRFEDQTHRCVLW